MLTTMIWFGMALAASAFAIFRKEPVFAWVTMIVWGFVAWYAYQHAAVHDFSDMQHMMTFVAPFIGICVVLLTYGQRKKDLAGPDADKGAYIDEDGTIHPRTQVLEVPRRRVDWGDIDRLPMDATEDRDYESSYSEAVHSGITTEAEARRERARKRKAKIAWGDFK